MITGTCLFRGRLGRASDANQITSLYDELSHIQSDLYSTTEVIQRNMSKQIMDIRTHNDDQTWMTSTSKKLRAESEAQPGISALASSRFNHTARGRGLDVRNPSRPIVASPGGPIWNFNGLSAGIRRNSQLAQTSGFALGGPGGGRLRIAFSDPPTHRW